jgi:hypothetical protein
MTASEDHGSQARHGTLRKQLHLRSLVLFGRSPRPNSARSQCESAVTVRFDTPGSAFCV